MIRAKGIPAVQIITANVNALNQGDFTKGHFFSGCFFRETNEWFFIDSNKSSADLKNVVRLYSFDPNSKFILDNKYYVNHNRSESR